MMFIHGMGLAIILISNYSHAAGYAEARFLRAKDSTAGYGEVEVTGDLPNGSYDFGLSLYSPEINSISRDNREEDNGTDHSDIHFAWIFRNGFRLGLGIGSYSTQTEDLSAGERYLQFGYQMQFPRYGARPPVVQDPYLEIPRPAPAVKTNLFVPTLAGKIQVGQNNIVQNTTPGFKDSSLELTQNWIEGIVSAHFWEWLKISLGHRRYSYNKEPGEIFSYYEYPYTRDRAGDAYQNNLAVLQDHSSYLRLQFYSKVADVEMRFSTGNETVDDSFYSDAYLSLVYYIKEQIGVGLGSGNSFYSGSDTSVAYSTLNLKVKF